MRQEDLKKIDFFKDYDLDYSFDFLTGVLNRETGVSYLNYLIQNKTPVTVCMIDIDNFKNVNDSYGHMIGDEVLKNIAKSIEEAMNNKGVLSRYGGDEFLAIIPNVTEYNDVWAICHDINLKMRNVKVKDIDDLNVTVTTGISRYPLDGASYDNIVNTADKALYRGKIKGRNCFIIYLEAKHKNIVIKSTEQNMYSTIEMQNKLFELLFAKTSLKRNIDNAIKYIAKMLHLSHVCIQNNVKVISKYIEENQTFTNFKYIDTDLFENVMNSYGLFFINKTNSLLHIGSLNLHMKLKEQNISATLAIKITSHGKTYGIIRADSINTKIWQNDEINIINVLSDLIGLMLYTNDTDLENLEKKK